MATALQLPVEFVEARETGREETVVGSPQGAVISPLMSNIYLHPLDLYWEREVKATKMVRYADDRAPRAQRAEEGPMCVTA